MRAPGTSAALALTLTLLAPLAHAQPAPASPPAPAPTPRIIPKPAPWDQSPAKDADPPLMPDPSALPAGPVSTSGTDVSPAAPAPAAAPVVVADSAADARRDARLRVLEARVASEEEHRHRQRRRFRWLRHLKVGAYVQPQLLISSYDAAASPNLQGGALPTGIGANDVIANPDGTTTNGSFMRLRRTRLRATFETKSSRLHLEIDPFPVMDDGRGGGPIARDAEVTGIVRWTPEVRTELSAGLFLLPLRLETLERADVRPFIERTWAVRSMLPLQRDVGAHARTFAFDDRLMVDVGVVNGQRLGQPHAIELPDLNKGKDLFAFAKYRLKYVSLAASGYFGRGEIVDAQQLRFKQFTRWWANVAATAHYPIARALGQTRVTAELAFAQNMDAGLFYPFAVPAIPARIQDDVTDMHERALYVRVEQEVGRWALVGYRYDFYSPDASIKNDARDTHAFVASIRFSRHLRWMNELDVVFDNVHPLGTGAPSRHALAFSSVFQAKF